MLPSVGLLVTAIWCSFYSFDLSRRCGHRMHPCAQIFLTFLLSMMFSSFCSAQYMLEVLEKAYTGYHVVLRCDATGADFGLSISSFSYGINTTGCAVFTEPEDACSTTSTSKINSTLCHGQFAIVPRGNCSFSEKAYHAQTGNPDPYKAIVIYNDPGEPPLPMQGSKYADEVNIPVAMVSYACMQNVMGRYPAESGYVVALRIIPGYYDFIKYLAPFVAVVGFCFIVLFISLVVRVCRERRRIARKRLSRSHLKKLPTKRYRKGDQPETCAVCLDDFVEGEKLRILPCKHAYHCKCIDPWLTKNRKVCPICKRKVCSTGDSDSSDSDMERRRADAAAGRATTTRENAPLLSNEQPMGVTSADSRSSLARGMRYLIDDDADDHVQSPSSSGGQETTQAIVHNEIDAMQGNVYADTVTVEDESSGGFSEALRKKLRPLRPFVYDLVSRAMRASGRLQQEPQSSGTDESRRRYAVENNAFDDLEVQPVPEGTLTEGPPSTEGEERLRCEAVVTRYEVPPCERRRRHPAAGGKLTDGKLDLDVELPSDESNEGDGCTSKVEVRTFGSPQRKVIKQHRGIHSSRSMPGGFSRGVLRARSVEDRTNDEAGSGDRELTTNRQRSHEEVIFKASIDLDEEHTASVSRLQDSNECSVVARSVDGTE
uniref:RING-type domain-containing protein n=1 Tax=Parascaris univalens TaxID=6257 RepID=A0A915A601_PARUN